MKIDGIKQTIPSGSVEELVEFFDTHDMGEHWDEMSEAHFEINLKKRTNLFAVEDDLVGKLTRIARSKHMSSEALINLFLREKLAEAT